MLRKGFLVSSISDADPAKCQGYPASVRVLPTNREVAEDADVVITGEQRKNKMDGVC